MVEEGMAVVQSQDESMLDIITVSVPILLITNVFSTISPIFIFPKLWNVLSKEMPDL